MGKCDIAIKRLFGPLVEWNCLIGCWITHNNTLLPIKAAKCSVSLCPKTKNGL
jgi:hypothetical protein